VRSAGCFVIPIEATSVTEGFATKARKLTWSCRRARRELSADERGALKQKARELADQNAEWSVKNKRDRTGSKRFGGQAAELSPHVGNIIGSSWPIFP